MEGNCKPEAYQRYAEEASKYTMPLSFEKWCEQINNAVFDIVAGC